ncbi:hypothetical protein ACHWQZ_G012972 [Mnemiopsis leidyi]
MVGLMSRRGGIRGRGRPFGHHNKAKAAAESGNNVSKKLLLNALKSGTLNLQNREMTVIPDDVYKLNDPELLQNLVGADDDLKWWETEPIAKLYLCSNKITTITPAIAGLNSLTLLDLRDNQLETVPEELSQLEVLVRLELSHNKLTTLPSTLGPALQQISLNNNNFEIMPPAISSLRSLQTLDIRENRLTTLGELPCCLQSLVVDDNKLSALHIENHQSLAAITATNNVLTSCRIGNLPQLKVLSVRVNKLEYLEPILNCPELGEILVGKNFINNIDFVVPCGAALTVLDCSDNKVTVLPEAITSMSKLKRLDVSNNSLNILPPQLALMDNLFSLSVEGNPLRTMRREIIAKGTNAIKDYLKLKLQPDSLEEAGPTIPDIKPDEIMMQTKTLELDRKTTVPNELWDQAVVCSIVRLSMQYCGLTVIPEQALNLRGSLQELELGSNNLHQLPPEIGKLVKLRKLNLLNNNLKELPEEISSLVALEDVNLGQNKFEHIPECLYSLPGICNLIISNNQIRTVEPAKLITMTSLVCLDLENNNIGRLPPELSLIPNIRTLLVMGNTFKIPRADVLAKGSAEVIAWLKNKVPQP